MGGLLVEFGKELHAFDEQGHPFSFRTQQECLIFGSLVLASPFELHRQKLAADLWPESSIEKASVSFRQRLSSIRRQFENHLVSDRTAISLHVPGSTVIVDPKTAADPDSLHSRCLALVEGALLDPHEERLNSSGWIRKQAASILDGSAPGDFTRKAIHYFYAVALDSSRDREDRLVYAVLAASNEGYRLDSSRIMTLPTEFDTSYLEDQFLRRCMAYLYQQAAKVAHGRGYWRRSALLEERGLHFSQSNWSRFRVIRKNIDIRLDTRAYTALLEFGASAAPDPDLLSYIDMNLVHAHALVGDYDMGHKAAKRCRARSRNSPSHVLENWLCLNEALLAMHSGNHRQALAHLIEADSTGGALTSPIDLVWHWLIAAQVFASMDDYRRTAVFSSLIERVCGLGNKHVSPTNLISFEARMEYAARRSSTTNWLEAIGEAENIPLAQMQDFYRSNLRQVLAA